MLQAYNNSTNFQVKAYTTITKTTITKIDTTKF